MVLSEGVKHRVIQKTSCSHIHSITSTIVFKHTEKVLGESVAMCVLATALVDGIMGIYKHALLMASCQPLPLRLFVNKSV